MMEFFSLSGFWVLIIVLIGLFCYFSVSNYDFWLNQGVPFIKPLPYFGNSLKSLLGLWNTVDEQRFTYFSFPFSPYVGSFILRKPILTIRDPELIHRILIEDFSSFYNRGINNDATLDPLGEHLVNLKDRKWKNVRTKLTPVFSSGKLKTMHHQLIYLSDAMAELMGKYTNGKPLDTREVMARFTTDVIGHCAFGITMNALDDTDCQFRKIGKEFFKPSIISRVRSIVRQVSPKLLKFLGWKEIPQEMEDFFVGVIKEAIYSREQNSVEVKDFLQLLINLKKEDDEKLKAGLILDDTNQDVILDELLMAANSFVFFLAGFETTAATLGFCLYELAQNQDIQMRLRSEIRNILSKHGGQPTFDAIKEMTYLDQCINETLRIYPPIPGLRRECTKDYQIPNSNIVLKRGQLVIIPSYIIQHDPKFFPNPEKFDPERFSDLTKIKKGTYLPFGDGPRICIGMRFARMEMKVLLSTLLMKYEFHPNKMTETPIRLSKKSFFLVPSDEIWLDIKLLKPL